jgi:CRISPR/Cas system-associated endonuclease Cas1
MILQWHKSMEPFYAEIERENLDSMIASKSVWFLERIDFADKWRSINGEERSALAQYFKGLNKLAKNYAMFKQQDLAQLVAKAAAAKAP